MHQLRHDIVQVLCKFEMIFPPTFFTSMIHVMVHLPEEALLAGPVNYRWMYPIERLLGELKKTVRNRAKPEGSIIEAWVQYESLTFCGMYLQDVDTAFNRPQRNNDGGVRNEKLSVFAQRARPFGDPVRGESFSINDMQVAHWFVLNNCDEIMAYLDEHEEMMKREHPSHLYATKHRQLFPQWFLETVNKLKSSNSPIYSEELYNLAFGPIRAELFSGCHVNGIKFLGAARDDKLCTQNNGVHVPGGGESTDIDFYDKLTMVVQLLYKDRYQVIMFKCRWFDTNPNRQGSVKIDHGLVSVNINRTWYDDDPFILANMAKQIVYLDDPKAGSGWKVVQHMDQRNVYAIPELDPTDNDVTNQRLESSMENDAETLRDTNVIQEPFQVQGVSSIEIPIQSITIDLGDLPRYDAEKILPCMIEETTEEPDAEETAAAETMVEVSAAEVVVEEEAATEVEEILDTEEATAEVPTYLVLTSQSSWVRPRTCLAILPIGPYNCELTFLTTNLNSSISWTNRYRIESKTWDHQNTVEGVIWWVLILDPIRYRLVNEIGQFRFVRSSFLNGVVCVLHSFRYWISLKTHQMTPRTTLGGCPCFLLNPISIPLDFVDVANLEAWFSELRGCARTRDVLLLDTVRLCAGVPARSTVRRDSDGVWVEDWWCRWWILGGAPARCSESDGRMIYGVNEAITGMVLQCLEKSRGV
ncbi:unnamed protein product [Prunus brigantina]